MNNLNNNYNGATNAEWNSELPPLATLKQKKPKFYLSQLSRSGLIISLIGGATNILGGIIFLIVFAIYKDLFLEQWISFYPIFKTISDADQIMLGNLTFFVDAIVIGWGVLVLVFSLFSLNIKSKHVLVMITGIFGLISGIIGLVGGILVLCGLSKNSH